MLLAGMHDHDDVSGSHEVQIGDGIFETVNGRPPVSAAAGSAIVQPQATSTAWGAVRREVADSMATRKQSAGGKEPAAWRHEAKLQLMRGGEHPEPTGCTLHVELQWVPAETDPWRALTSGQSF